jgi:hypothetical protein
VITGEVRDVLKDFPAAIAASRLCGKRAVMTDALSCASIRSWMDLKFEI